MKLSILVLTYNHGEFLTQALDSILQQEVDFDYEIVVSSDFSTDQSFEILKDYQKRYPEKFKLLLSTQRTGGKKNAIRGLNAVEGQYLSILDGDDYWTNKKKLQTQIAFLDSHPDYVGCAHNTLVVREDNSKPSELLNPVDLKDTHSITDLIDGTSYFHISSLVWRNVFKGVVPIPFYDPNVGDYFLSMLYAEHGKIGYISSPMSTYRIHGKGYWSTHSPISQLAKNIDLMVRYNHLLGYRYQWEFRRIWWSCDLILEMLEKDRIGWPFKQKYEYLKRSVVVDRNPDRYSRYFYKRAYQLISLIARFYKI